jgi:DNA polymerase III delta' subunit
MAQIKWKQLAGQERIKDVLGAAYEHNTLGHAYLFCGESGTGKFAAALELGMALLCKSELAHPCYECEACRKVMHYTHPDFHVILPVSLQKEHKSDSSKLTDDGWKYISEAIGARIANPYFPREFSTIPSIPVEWMRELNHAVLRGALEGGKNVAILDGVDTMNKESANSMLKTLEEPPEGTIMILLTNRINSVLPTLVSRCQILRFSTLSPDVIRREISARYGIDPSDPKVEAVLYTGSLGKSIFLYENPSEEISRVALEFWNFCAANDWDAIAARIDNLSEIDDYSTFEKFFTHMMHFIRNAFYNKLKGTENYIIGKGAEEFDLKGISDPVKIEELVQTCQNAIGWIQSRAQISLVLVQFAISVMETINGKKQ